MKAGGHGVKVIQKGVWHNLSHSDKEALKANVAKGAGKIDRVIIEEAEAARCSHGRY